MQVDLTERELELLGNILAELYPEARGLPPDDAGHYMTLIEDLRVKLHAPPDKEREPKQSHEQLVEQICGKVALDWKPEEEALARLAGFLACRTYPANLPYVVELAGALAAIFEPLEASDVLFLLADAWAQYAHEEEQEDDDAED